jgi:DNA ligase 1
MSNKFKPLLAVACQDITTLNYPVIASVKCDGIRAIIKNGVVYSRTMKPIPSETVQQKFGKLEYEGLDGELVYGDLYAPDAFNKSTSFCMSKKVPEGLEPENIVFYAFDVVEDVPYANRLFYVADKVNGESMKMLPQHWMKTPEELKLFQTKVVEAGGEGVMIRSPEGRYKQGRSTLKEGILLKLKIFTDEEAFVVGFEEKMHNTNEAKVDELGYTDRSTSKEGMVPANTLGALVVESKKWGKFNIGTGFDDKLRQEIWDKRSDWMGRLVKFKYFEVGVMEKPRFPVFLGLRDKIDM